MRDFNRLHGDALKALREAGNAALAASGVEQALLPLSTTVHGLLGDKEAHLRSGALKPGERQFSVAGYFMVTPDRKQHILLAEVGFPAEQHRLRIGIDLGHPGWVVRNRKALILANTDLDPEFKQILKTARMGSALYAPLWWRGELFGQLVLASQARNTYEETDLEILLAFANLAASLWMAHGGPAFLAGLG
jgi:GAF domain-containing protein